MVIAMIISSTSAPSRARELLNQFSDAMIAALRRDRHLSPTTLIFEIECSTADAHNEAVACLIQELVGTGNNQEL
jgi:hypothetical protein